MTPAENAPAIVRTRAVATGHWRAFLAVARHLNFRAAADELALTQSAVSRQIQALEEEVGVALFLRHTRAVELTSAGAQHGGGVFGSGHGNDDSCVGGMNSVPRFHWTVGSGRRTMRCL